MAISSAALQIQPLLRIKTRAFFAGAGTGSYGYDNNGNLQTDPYKGLNITYNFLNLPTSVQKGSESIILEYDAAGVKLRKVVDATNAADDYTKEYVSGIEYKDNAIESIYHEEGRVVPDGNGFRYEWMIKDHLGNTRVLFADLDEDGKIEGDDPGIPSNESELMQIHSYYPFGMLHEGNWNGTTNTTALEYGFGGKELNEDLGLNWMDFGGRWYMADLCRWGQVDPLAEQGYSRTPYHYVRNNPLAFVDPTGLGEDPAPLPGATVYSEENANRKKRKEAYDEQQRERDREYGLSSPRGDTKDDFNFIIQVKRRKGETRSGIARRLGIDKKYVGNTEGTARTYIPVLNVGKLEQFQNWLENFKIDYKPFGTLSSRIVTADQTTYGAFVSFIIDELLDKGLFSKANPQASHFGLTIAQNEFVPIGFNELSFEGGSNYFKQQGFETRAELWDKNRSIVVPHGPGQAIANIPALWQLTARKYPNYIDYLFDLSKSYGGHLSIEA